MSVNPIKTYTEKRFFEWHEDDISVTLRNAGASYGGGSEVLIIVQIFDARGNGGGVSLRPSPGIIKAE